MSEELKLDARELQLKTLFDEQKRKITNLERDLENERKLNAEIKARFVKCNTCTPDMKDKCPMFHENLCEGERCEELVDLMSLVEKRDHDDKLEKAVGIIKRWYETNRSDYIKPSQELIEVTEQFLKENSHD